MQMCSRTMHHPRMHGRAQCSHHYPVYAQDQPLFQQAGCALRVSEGSSQPKKDRITPEVAWF